jgi:Leucine-rich repeat (LRR) protein
LIEEIPNEIVNMKNLRLVDLSYNQIKKIPEGIKTLFDIHVSFSFEILFERK